MHQPAHLHGGHLVVHVQNPQLRSSNVLHVIGVCMNPVRWQSRYRITRDWIIAMKGTENTHLTIVEAAFGDRQHELAQLCQELGVDYIPLRTSQELWIKENMINIAYKHITVKYPEAKYFAHINADVFFRNAHWAQETLHQLQHFSIVQPWSDSLDLGPHGEVLQAFKSFGHQHQKRIQKQKHSKQPYQYAHSGYAWAWTRDFWERTRGLMDWPILGSADHHMAFAMIGETKDTIHAKMHPNFFRMCYEWQDRALEATHGEVGYVPGRIEHLFHGPKSKRYYRERWQILVDHKFDPLNDLMYDRSGVIQLKAKPALLHEIHAYNLSRREDSIEI